MRNFVWIYEGIDGEDHFVHFPAKWEICYRCNGDGHHDHPAFSNGITSSEWAEWDDDDRENYLSGRYDVRCEECKGEGKILVIDEESCKHNKELMNFLEQYHEEQNKQAEFEREWEAERRRGA
jgi:DnaJ-class molecular chaperone